MKFVQIDAKTGVVSWDRYFEYLEGNKHAFPDRMYEYVSDWDHYSLNGDNSLHDAWVDSIRFFRSESRVESIEIMLLGARHDRLHQLVYRGVEKFDFSGLNPSESGASDLIVHEFTVDGLMYTHEMQFGGSAKLVVTFNDFQHETKRKE